MENEKNIRHELSCTDCGLYNCRHHKTKYPPFCLTTNKVSEEDMEEAVNIYNSDTVDGRMARSSACIEGENFMKKTRVEETVMFIKAIGAKKVGIATCAGLIEEAKTFAKILKKNDIEYYSVICKVGSTDKASIGIPEESKIIPGSFEPMCNPIMQARLLNRAETDLNVIIGLCVGHDSLFTKYSEAPVTTLVTKDRVLGHNPIAALYSGYYKNLWD
ncbi:DUF1847 domain-containing protein [uncultured Clostridium sp.]|uniref:DUF1847 domain-containing protein n=1 Tax=uncultured Clostridium sp. TaxID=59620 RepID=UPI0025D6393D|nr:DUF1847 domain-containing protein [uncultured Clostridium sp.]